MTTYADLSAKLLKEAAGLFKMMAGENTATQKQMNENARLFEQMAGLIASQPTGGMADKTYAAMTADLLNNAAQFFRALGEQNEPIREQMMLNADIYQQMAQVVAQNPLGIAE